MIDTPCMFDCRKILVSLQACHVACLFFAQYLTPTSSWIVVMLSLNTYTHRPSLEVAPVTYW